jgi:hypothetical protein
VATFYNQEFSFAKTAKELLEKYPLSYQKDGYYMLYPSGRTGPGQVVYCDMTTDGGGWMMIARSHPSTVNYNGQNWGWRGGPIGSIKDFSQAYQAGWLTYWDSIGQTFTEFIFGNRSNINNNTWGPFIYKRGITYTDFINSDTQQGGSTSTLKSDTNVYGTTSFPGMQGAIGYPVTGTSNNIYYMRDCCGFSGYGGTATSMVTTYCGANFYYAGPWCGGSTTDGSGNFQNGTYVSNGLTFGGTNQYMIMVR